MAVYALIHPAEPYPVVNVVNFGTEIPPERDSDGNWYVPYVDEVVGDPYDLPGYIRDKARADAAEQLNSPDFTGKAFRSAVDLSVNQFNLHRADVVGIGTATAWNPANLANNTGETSPNITVTGAQFGDEVSGIAPYSLQGATVTAYVSAPNTVQIRIQNGSGGALNFAAGDWKAVVYRPVARPPLTVTQGLNAMVNTIAAGGVD